MEKLRHPHDFVVKPGRTLVVGSVCTFISVKTSRKTRPSVGHNTSSAGMPSSLRTRADVKAQTNVISLWKLPSVLFTTASVLKIISRRGSEESEPIIILHVAICLSAMIYSRWCVKDA